MNCCLNHWLGKMTLSSGVGGNGQSVNGERAVVRDVEKVPAKR